MNISKISCMALWINSALGLSVALSATAIAADMTAVQFQLDSAEMHLVSVPSILLPFKNQFFLYGVDASRFDLADFLYVNAPDLADKEEVITHWAGYYSINPKVVLTLMEMQSQLISSPTVQALDRPLGALSKRYGFDAQLQDVLAQLSQGFYAYEEFQLTGQPQSTEAMNAATFALMNLLSRNARPESGHSQMATDGPLQLDQFIEQLGLLFGDKGADLGVHVTANTEHIAPAVARSSVVAQASNEAINLSANSLPPQNMLQMPWRVGYSWASNGAHSHTGSGYPFSSIDVSYDWPRWGQPTYSVAAAHAGTVNVLSRCQVRVTNANGWATNYYHMDQISVGNGQYVDRNTVLGIYASNQNTALCQGGSSTGPHLHFSLLKDGRHVSLQGVNLGRYRINVGNANYDNYCGRFNMFDLSNNRTVCAWAPVYNSGSL